MNMLPQSSMISASKIGGMAATIDPIVGIKFSAHATNPHMKAKGTFMQWQRAQASNPVLTLASVFMIRYFCTPRSASSTFNLPCKLFGRLFKLRR